MNSPIRNLQLSQQRAAQELLRRRRARESLIDYARFTNRAYRPADHHELIASKLEQVERGECKRLMIFMPPRHGKSELGSRRFPAWFMGRTASRSIIAASYNSDLAGDFGREVRNIMASTEHKALFPSSELAADSKSQNRWHTREGGGYAAAGVGTAVTGRGANLLLIDDPVKDRESADSETLREKTYRWYLSTAYTRLEGALVEEDSDPLWHDMDEAQEKGEAFEGAIVLIQTRWHEDDLAGRLLLDMERGADQWDVLSLPALGADGGALWPAKYPVPRLEAIKRALSSREWNALYQQTPVADEGTYFQRGWFKRHDQPQKGNRYFITGDFAVTEDGGDFTELGVWGIGQDGGIQQVDWWGGQATALVWIEKLIDLMAHWGVRAFFGETGQIRRAVEPLLRKRMRERNVFCRLEWLSRPADKAAMARAFQGRAEMGLVSIARTKDGDALLDQMMTFPAGKNDDKVDACALLGMAINMAHPALALPKNDEPERRRGDYGYADDEDEGETWKIA